MNNIFFESSRFIVFAKSFVGKLYSKILWFTFVFNRIKKEWLAFINLYELTVTLNKRIIKDELYFLKLNFVNNFLKFKWTNKIL
jgi:hypothetical protein